MRPNARLPDIDSLIIYRGIEKEGLRVTPDTQPASTPHPAALGSALKNPLITTDFSEALPEIVTGIHLTVDKLFRELEDLNTFLIQAMEPTESLWAASMPPYIESANTIAIAQYGTSHIAQLKHLYRVGLSNRYGRVMQSIAGIHYNISYHENLFFKLAKLDNLSFSNKEQLKSHYYMQLVRHFHKLGWLLILLFGASPIAMRPSVRVNNVDSLERYSNRLYVGRTSTSLRLSPLGYQNTEIDTIAINYDNHQQYALDLLKYTQTPSKQFSHIPTLLDNNPRQINHSILQIENEFYGSIRPKPKFVSSEMPSLSLYHNGVEYVEIRIFDLNPLLPLGLDKAQVAFADAFLTHCLLTHTVEIKPVDAQNNTANVINNGLSPDCNITNHSGKTNIQNAATQLLLAIRKTAQWMDTVSDNSAYENAVLLQIDKIQSWNQFINLKILDHVDNYEDYINTLSIQHSRYFRGKTLDNTTRSNLHKIAHQSTIEQAVLEENDSSTDFLEFYQDYIAKAVQVEQ